MRHFCLFLAALLFAASCDREAGSPEETQTQETQGASGEAAGAIEALVSDELPGLPAAATGIAFWDHPTLTFNGLMMVATEAGVIAYSMEDGVEVSRIDSAKAKGLAAGYFGEGANAVGVVAFRDADANAFRYYGVDNTSRAFIPLDGGPQVAGGVRAFCMGRGAGVEASSLFVIQKGKIEVFNLAAGEGGVSAESALTIEAPDNLASCAVDIDGRLLAASDRGEIYRLDENAFGSPLARSDAQGPGALAVIGVQIAAQEASDAPLTTGQILFADLSTGVIHVFESLTGEALGAVKIAATNELPGVDRGEAFAATGANFGGLYRNGVLAVGVANGADGPMLSLVPASAVRNALSLPVGEPVSSRRETLEVEEGALFPEPDFTPQ